MITGFAFAQFSCFQLLNTDMNRSVLVNASTSACFTPTSGIFVAALPPYVPAIDTAYITQQDPKGNAYFITDSCIGFDAFGTAGNATIEYTIRTTNGCTKSGTLNITIICPKPIAHDEYVAVFSDVANQPIVIGTNDTAIIPPATYTIIIPPTHGTAAISNDTIYYSGDNTYVGEDVLAYVIENACGEKDTAAILLLESAHEAPSTTGDTLLFNLESTVCKRVNVLRNDFSIYPNDSLFLVSFDSISANQGTITRISDSTLCYFSDVSKLTEDAFTYTVCNTYEQCTTQTVTVIIPAVAYSDTNTVVQGTQSFLDVKLNDAWIDSPFVQLCGGQPLHGFAYISSNNTISYTPDKDFPSPASDQNLEAGLDSFCYRLCVTIDGQAYCDTSMAYVTVVPGEKIFIPKGFSPNGDGINDALVMVTNGSYPNSHLIVYNRWGDEVWRGGPNYGNNFTGTNDKGVPLPDGTYFYIFKFNDGKKQDISGYTIINR